MSDTWLLAFRDIYWDTRRLPPLSFEDATGRVARLDERTRLEQLTPFTSQEQAVKAERYKREAVRTSDVARLLSTLRSWRRARGRQLCLVGVEDFTHVHLLTVAGWHRLTFETPLECLSFDGVVHGRRRWLERLRPERPSRAGYWRREVLPVAAVQRLVRGLRRWAATVDGGHERGLGLFLVGLAESGR